MDLISIIYSCASPGCEETGKEVKHSRWKYVSTGSRTSDPCFNQTWALRLLSNTIIEVDKHLNENNVYVVVLYKDQIRWLTSRRVFICRKSLNSITWHFEERSNNILYFRYSVILGYMCGLCMLWYQETDQYIFEMWIAQEMRSRCFDVAVTQEAWSVAIQLMLAWHAVLVGYSFYIPVGQSSIYILKG